MEQGKHPKQTKTAYVITGAALLAAAIFIIVIAWTSKKEAPDCVRIHDTELKIKNERKPLK
jgi:hypothetical protein